MEAALQFIGGSGSAVPIKEKEPAQNPWLRVVDASLGARQGEFVFEEFVSDWDQATRSSVSLGAIVVPRALPKSAAGQETNHRHAGVFHVTPVSLIFQPYGWRPPGGAERKRSVNDESVAVVLHAFRLDPHP